MNVVKPQASAVVTAPGAAAPVGRALDGRYRLEGEIGSGGLGAVYRATHEKLEKPVAIKLLHDHCGGDPVARGRFEREAKALASLSHPNIVSVLDFGVEGDVPYLVMELLEGETLAECLQRGPLSEPLASELALALLEALAYVHEAGMVHRDVKPGNVFLQDKREAAPRLKLLDFGLAKSLEPDAPDALLTRSGSVLGTPAYMSPEQASGEAADMRSDVYAAGVMILEMLTGRTPYVGDAIEQLRGHLLAAIPSLHELHPTRRATPELDAFIARALAKRRQDRFENAKQMLEALSALTRPWFTDDVRRPTPANDVGPVAEAPTVNVATSGAPDAPEQAAASVRPRPRARLLVAGVSLIAALGLAAYLAQRAELPRMPWRWPDSQPTPTVNIASEPPSAAAPDGTNTEGATQLSAAEPSPPEPAAASGEPARAPAPGAELAAASGNAENTPPAEPAGDLGEADSLDGPAVDAPPAHAEAIESERDEVPASLPPVVKPRSPAKNPWNRGVPRDLRAARAAAMSGARGNDPMIASVRRYNREHPSDVRGHLVLARLYKNREWCSDAMYQYRIAYQMDPGSRGAPETLPSLLGMVAHGCAAGSAARFIEQAYRGNALGATQQALRTFKNDARAVARLGHLRARLATKK